MRDGRFENLDVLRGLAALAVVFAHIVGLSDVAVPHASRIWGDMFSLAVPMFFALSAFSLAYRYEGRLGTLTELGEYALRRFLRIAPLFYFMLALYVARRFIKYGYLPPPSELFLNLTFLFGFSSAHYQSLVAAGWSLGVEMSFYAILPILFIGIRGAGSAAVATIVALFAGFVVYQATAELNSSFRVLNFVSSLANFMGGLTAYYVFRRFEPTTPEVRQRVSLACLGLAAAIWIWFYCSPSLFGAPASYGWRYFVSAAFPFIILSAALGNWGLITNAFSLRMGLWSYSIYLLHPFVLVFAIVPARHAVYEALAGHPVWVPFTISTVGIYICVIGCAFLTHRFIEQPFEQLGKSLSRRRVAPSMAPAE